MSDEALNQLVVGKDSHGDVPGASCKVETDSNYVS